MSEARDTTTYKLPTMTCRCGLRYLVFRDVRISDDSLLAHRYRDFYEPDGQDLQVCKLCGANLEAVRREAHRVGESFRKGKRSDD